MLFAADGKALEELPPSFAMHMAMQGTHARVLYVQQSVGTVCEVISCVGACTYFSVLSVRLRFKL